MATNTGKQLPIISSSSSSPAEDTTAAVVTLKTVGGRVFKILASEASYGNIVRLVVREWDMDPSDLKLLYNHKVLQPPATKSATPAVLVSPSTTTKSNTEAEEGRSTPRKAILYKGDRNDEEPPVVPEGAEVIVIGVRTPLKTPTPSKSAGSSATTPVNRPLLQHRGGTMTPPTPSTPGNVGIISGSPQSPATNLISINPAGTAGGGPLVYPHAPDGLKGLAESVNSASRTVDKFEKMNGHSTMREIRKIVTKDDDQHSKITAIFNQAQAVAPEFVTMVNENKQLFLDVLNGNPPAIPLQELVGELGGLTELASLMENFFGLAGDENLDLLDDPANANTQPAETTDADERDMATELEADLTDALHAGQQIDRMLVASIYNRLATIYGRLFSNHIPEGAHLSGAPDHEESSSHQQTTAATTSTRESASPPSPPLTSDGRPITFDFVVSHHQAASDNLFLLWNEVHPGAIALPRPLLGDEQQQEALGIVAHQSTQQQQQPTPRSGDDRFFSNIVHSFGTSVFTTAFEFLTKFIFLNDAQHRDQAAEALLEVVLRFNKFLTAVHTPRSASSTAANNATKDKEEQGTASHGHQQQQQEGQGQQEEGEKKKKKNWGSQADDGSCSPTTPRSFLMMAPHKLTVPQQRAELMQYATTNNTNLVLMCPLEWLNSCVMLLIKPGIEEGARGESTGTSTSSASRRQPLSSSFVALSDNDDDDTTPAGSRQQVVAEISYTTPDALQGAATGFKKPSGAKGVSLSNLRMMWRERGSELYKSLWTPLTQHIPTNEKGLRSCASVHYIFPTVFRFHPFPLNAMTDENGMPLASSVALSQSVSIEGFLQATAVPERAPRMVIYNYDGTHNLHLQQPHHNHQPTPAAATANGNNSSGSPQQQQQRVHRSAGNSFPAWMSRNLRRMLAAEVHRCLSPSAQHHHHYSGGGVNQEGGPLSPDNTTGTEGPIPNHNAEEIDPRSNNHNDGSTCSSTPPPDEHHHHDHQERESYRPLLPSLVHVGPPTYQQQRHHEEAQLQLHALPIHPSSDCPITLLVVESGSDASPLPRGTQENVKKAVLLPVMSSYNCTVIGDDTTGAPYELMRNFYVGLSQGLSVAHAARKGLIESQKMFPDEPWRWADFCVMNYNGVLKELSTFATTTRQELQEQKRSEAQRTAVRSSREFRYLSTHGVGPLFEHMLQALLRERPSSSGDVLSTLISNLEASAVEWTEECHHAGLLDGAERSPGSGECIAPSTDGPRGKEETTAVDFVGGGGDHAEAGVASPDTAATPASMMMPHPPPPRDADSSPSPGRHSRGGAGAREPSLSP